MWPMPLSDEYRDDIKSDIADIKNSAGREGGAIYGAAFVDAVVDAGDRVGASRYRRRGLVRQRSDVLAQGPARARCQDDRRVSE